MPNPIKIIVSLLIIAALFKLGYQKGALKHPARLPAQAKPSASRYQYMPFSELGPSAGKPRFFLNGIPTEVGAYNSNVSSEREAKQFEDKWAAQGCKTKRQAFGNMQILSALNENSNRLNLAILLAAPSKQTMVIPAELDLSRPPLPAQYRTPIYPNARTVFHIESNDLAGYSENLILLSEAPVQKIMRYYQTQLLQEGWQILAAPKKKLAVQDAEELLLVKGADERWLHVSRMDDENKTFVFLLYTDRY